MKPVLIHDEMGIAVRDGAEIYGGGELTIDLPGPGCWLGYSGEGCFGDPPGMVEAACGETVEWVLTSASHVCAGL